VKIIQTNGKSQFSADPVAAAVKRRTRPTTSRVPPRHLGGYTSWQTIVAQISNLPYRRILFCGIARPPALGFWTLCRLQIGDTAD